MGYPIGIRQRPSLCYGESWNHTGRSGTWCSDFLLLWIKIKNKLLSLLELTESGLFCPPAGIFIDPWRAVDRAVITHAHSDHSRWGMKHYLAHHHSAEVMKLRLGKEINLQTVDYNQPLLINGVQLSFHPAWPYSRFCANSSWTQRENRGSQWRL